INWLKDYIPFDMSINELANQLTMVGLEVENIHPIKQLLRSVIIGKILQIERHPSAKKLYICHVDVGTGILNIVCGAPNIKIGQTVPVAKVGAVLGDCTPVQQKSIHGIQSEGMICSEKELGLSNDHSGVLVLDGSQCKIGEPYRSECGIQDSILEINITPNRPDCLSYIGIAREIGVILGNEITIPEIAFEETDSLTKDRISIQVQDPKLCPRYCGRIVEHVHVGPSPQWLKNRLESIGMRTVNNVVDITNYILMETGHPLHSFDYDLIQNEQIVVRNANDKEYFITLDDESVELNSNDLLICDGDRGIALAGIMGGRNSEISDSTQTVFLESAYFNPTTIRKTAKRLGITTEASLRFERGVDPNNTVYAINRAVQLISEIADGKVTKGIVDIYPYPMTFQKVLLRMSRISNILGMEIPTNKTCSILKRLGIQVTGKDPIEATIPTFRPDLKKEIDLIEEIIRHFGYEKIEPKICSVINLNDTPNRGQEFTETIRDVLVGMGFLETVNVSLVSKNHTSLMNQQFINVQVQNPLTPENMFLRTSIIPNLLDIIQWNNNHSTNNLRLFEIGNVFSAKEKSLPDEHLFVAGVISGFVRPNPFWGEKNIKVNFHHLKGIVETLLAKLHITECYFEHTKHPTLNPQFSQILCWQNKNIGIIGEIEKSILDRWDIGNEVFIFEISLKNLFDIFSQKITYQSITKYPFIKRDLAIIVDENISVGSLHKLIHKTGGKQLFSVEFFDLYRGKQIPAGKKSVAFSLTFLSQSRTLKEEEVDPIIVSILDTLGKTFYATLRS
ncbi:phenylalanine--tRNA ligase subunit beta, partial [bacterium]|nr:phenylalanine--tRNA ligase subunit beta [bacterium]